MRPRFFRDAAALRRWFHSHHTSSKELQVGFHKLGTGKPSVTWPQSVDEALCVGWIDGVRKRIDESSYQIRFTPRKPGSIWSSVNIARAKALARTGRMLPAGERAFAARRGEKSKVYSYEQGHAAPDSAVLRALRSNTRAWSFFQTLPPSYRKKLLWWVASAKQAKTRESRLKRIIEAASAGRRL